jgi:4a-hydroxytetrahydrobiopterin dehydratase
MELAQQKCVPCEGGMPPMSQEGIAKNLPLVPKWELQDGRLVRICMFKDFVEAMTFVNKVAVIAESEGHHPDLSIFYNKVAIALWTHAVGGLSVNDFILAAKINEIGG